jgi:hypothetical protein
MVVYAFAASSLLLAKVVSPLGLLPWLVALAAIAGSTNMSSLVVMSKGTKFTQQSYKVSDSFPFEWIKKKWREAFHVTAMATSGTQARACVCVCGVWGVSRSLCGFPESVAGGAAWLLPPL